MHSPRNSYKLDRWARYKLNMTINFFHKYNLIVQVVSLKDDEKGSFLRTVRRSVNYASGDDEQAASMRSVLLAMYDTSTYPLDLKTIRILDKEAQNDALSLLTWYSQSGSNEHLCRLLYGEKELFVELVEREIKAILDSATDRKTWLTGFWKENAKEAMLYRFGKQQIEAFDDLMLFRHLQSMTKVNNRT